MATTHYQLQSITELVTILSSEERQTSISWNKDRGPARRPAHSPGSSGTAAPSAFPSSGPQGPRSFPPRCLWSPPPCLRAPPARPAHRCPGVLPTLAVQAGMPPGDLPGPAWSGPPTLSGRPRLSSSPRRGNVSRIWPPPVNIFLPQQGRRLRLDAEPAPGTQQAPSKATRREREETESTAPARAASHCACACGAPPAPRGRGAHCACPARASRTFRRSCAPRPARWRPPASLPPALVPPGEARHGKGSGCPLGGPSPRLPRVPPPPDPTRGGLASLGSAGSGARFAVSTPALARGRWL